uniref:Putative secreted peptide n=1 Tax=Anopheles braziliensis TaxID=58242 RepID=A0A2M3ZR37_9DIPT
MMFWSLLCLVCDTGSSGSMRCILVHGKLSHRGSRTGYCGSVVWCLLLVGSNIAWNGFNYAHQNARIGTVALCFDCHQRNQRLQYTPDVHDRLARFFTHRGQRVDTLECVQQQHNVVQTEKQCDLIVQLLV